jgi:hypothetical protein
MKATLLSVARPVPTVDRTSVYDVAAMKATLLSVARPKRPKRPERPERPPQ